MEAEGWNARTKEEVRPCYSAPQLGVLLLRPRGCSASPGTGCIENPCIWTHDLILFFLHDGSYMTSVSLCLPKNDISPFLSTCEWYLPTLTLPLRLPSYFADSDSCRVTVALSTHPFCVTVYIVLCFVGAV